MDGCIVDFLPADLRREYRLEESDNISAHAYDSTALRIIDEVRSMGGKVLDCGSGLRADIDETVVCLEVTPYPTVDVLAVNQRLPFRNEAFDAVLSLNVLEHVTDPFACAAELVRVLKPTGYLYCCIPFLQPEHGYPDHYFNATRSGLRQLFANRVQLVEHMVPGSGEPVWSLQRFVTQYASHLPPAERAKFLNLRIKDFVGGSAVDLLGKPWVEQLSEEGKWQLASTTAAVFQKR
jgi:SAM-dependent methyltransferase